MDEEGRAKHKRIYQDMLDRITGGELSAGGRLPTERELVELYQVSRPTVSKALARLQQEGIITRRAGSGSYVCPITANGHGDDGEAPVAVTRFFGLLIPKLGVTEIFEPICGRIAQLSRVHNFNLLWGDSATHSLETIAEDLEQGCLRYIEQGVDGLFFVPLELVPRWEDTNRRIVRHLKAAGIPVVMLDADYVPYPQRSDLDLVGIDNTRTGYRAARHYLEQGAQRIDFVYRPFSAHTVQARLNGCRLALAEQQILMSSTWIHCGDPDDPAFTRHVLASGAHNIVCANDSTAISLMRGIEDLHKSVPGDVRLIGFDNIKYSEYARIPLTTFQQPCYELGEIAVEQMLIRLQNREHAPSSRCAEPEFLVRSSSILPG